MTVELKNCWEVTKCGREKGGNKVDDQAECIVSQRGMGHSCWIMAGTLCDDATQGTWAQKVMDCLRCEVYRMYNRINGTFKPEVPGTYPDEQTEYRCLLMEEDAKIRASKK